MAGEMIKALSALVPALIAMPLMLVPFIIAEQIWPLAQRPGWRDYALNIVISMSTMLITLPLAVMIGFAAQALRGWLPWEPVNFTYSDLATVPVIGDILVIAAMVLLPLLVHDLWFYWAHRIEHRVGFLWEFHKLHHSDERMNCSTWARDHFLQAAWIATFPVLTLGLIFDLDAIQAGMAGVLSGLAISLLSMTYHSAIRLNLRWLDRILVTPRLHRVHHSVDPAHHARNFADVFPFLDMLFGTYYRPRDDEVLVIGLGNDMPPPRNIWAAQIDPARRGLRALLRQAQ